MKRIQIIGAGAVGMLLGSFLVERGMEVHFVCRRQEQVEDLNECLSRENLEGKVEHFTVSASLGLIKDADLTIVAVKSRDVAELLPLLSNDTAILFIQNGLTHFELVKNTTDLHHISFSSVQFGAAKISNHLVSQRGVGIMKVARGTLPAAALQVMVNWSDEKFPVEIVDDGVKMLYEKAIFNSLINPLTAILQVQNGALVQNEYAFTLMKAMYDELALSFPEYCPTFEAVCALCERTATNTSSMLADHQNKKRSEIREIVGVLLQQAASKKITLPTLETVYNFVLAKELSEGFGE